MGFDVYGPARKVCASNIDDGAEPSYDLLAMPADYGLRCPELENLSRRFYATTTVCHAGGHVQALRDELVGLRDAYRARREPELIRERHVQARDSEVRRAILERLLEEDTVYHALDEFCLLCDEAIAAEADLRCVGD